MTSHFMQDEENCLRNHDLHLLQILHFALVTKLWYILNQKKILLQSSDLNEYRSEEQLLWNNSGTYLEVHSIIIILFISFFMMLVYSSFKGSENMLLMFSHE